MKAIHMIRATLLAHFSLTASSVPSTQPGHLKFEMTSEFGFGFAAASEELTLKLHPAQGNKGKSPTSCFESFGDNRILCTSSQGHENFICKEIRQPETASSYSSSINLLSPNSSNIFEAILHDQHSRCPSSEFSSTSLTLHSCHSGIPSSRNSFNDEGQRERLARLYSSAAPTIVLDRTDGYNLAEPIVCFLGSSAIYKVLAESSKDHRGYRGKPFGSWRPFGFVLSLQLLLAKTSKASPLNPSSSAQEVYFSSKSPNPATTAKSPPPHAEPSLSPPKVGSSSQLANHTQSPTESPTRLETPSLSSPVGGPSQPTNPKPSPTETALQPTKTSDSIEEEANLLPKPFSWLPVGGSAVLDLAVLFIAWFTGWPRATTLITVFFYTSVVVVISREDSPDFWLGVIAWLNIGGFVIWFSFLDIRALWAERQPGSDHGYGVYFLLVLIVAGLTDLVYSGGVADTETQAKALYGVIHSWLFSSIIIGRIVEIDDHFHPRGQLRVEDVEAARDEEPGQVTAGLLQPSQSAVPRIPSGRVNTWIAMIKSLFDISSLLPGITSKLTSSLGSLWWGQSGHIGGNNPGMDAPQPGALQPDAAQVNPAQTDSGEPESTDESQGNLFSLADDSDEDGHEPWRRP